MEKINILFYQKSGCTCQVARKSIDWWKPFLRPSALHPSRECFKSFHFDPHLLPASCSITIGNKTLWINVYFFFYFLLFRLPPIITNIDRTLTGKSILILSPYGNHFATPVALSKVRELKKLCWGEKKDTKSAADADTRGQSKRIYSLRDHLAFCHTKQISVNSYPFKTL